MKRLTPLILIFLVVFVNANISAQNNKPDLPAGKWGLSCAPSKTRGAVVDLYAVGTDSSKGFTVSDIWLENRSSQDVAAVKIGWKLYERSAPQTVLLTGETPDFLGVALASGEKRVVNFPVLSFAKIYRPLLRGNKLEGRYKIELWVTEVTFDVANANQRNGPLATAWTASSKVHVREVSSRPVTSEDDDDLGCQNQECDFYIPDNCYKCVSSMGSTCAWSNCSYCKNSRCQGLIE